MEASETILHAFTEELYSLTKKPIILIPISWSNLTPGEIELLQKILRSIKRNMDGVNILFRPKIDLEEVKIYSPSAILSFGSDVKQIPNTNELEYWDGIPCIKTNSLGSISDEEKTKLWSALQQAFLST